MPPGSPRERRRAVSPVAAAPTWTASGNAMAAERRQAGEWKRIELQLDTAQIVLVIASLLGLCTASFFLGRWLERDRWQDLSGRSTPQSTKIQETDAAAGLTFFDTLG